MDDRAKESTFDYKNYQRKCTKLPQVAASLQQILPDVPDNLLDLLRNYNCALCSSFIPTLKYAVSHYNTEEHQNRLINSGINRGLFQLPFSPSQIMDLETGVLIYARGTNKVHLVDPISKAKTEEIKMPETVDKLDLEYCAICNVPFNSSLMALKHYGGKKHKQRFFAKLTAPLDSRAMTEDFRCSLCNVCTSSEDTLQTHFDGKAHLKKLHKCIDENNMRSIPPESSAKWGAIDYDSEPDDSYQPFGIPAPFFDCKLTHHTPHVRLEGPYVTKKRTQIKPEPNLTCHGSRIEVDRFIDYDKDILKHYLETVYK